MDMSQSLSTTDVPDQIDCLLMPLKDKTLVLPNVAVAEIIPFTQLQQVYSEGEWLIGHIDWRGVEVPAVCYEMLCDQPAPEMDSRARFAVINGVGNHVGMPFYALLLQGIPRLIYIREEDIQEVDVLNAGRFDQKSVTLDRETVIIPNLDLLEEELISRIKT